jgi:hypothetical protein
VEWKNCFGRKWARSTNTVLWIRIRIKFYKLDPEPDPDSHQFADVKPECVEYEPILAFFQGSGYGSASGWKIGSGSASTWCGSTTLPKWLQFVYFYCITLWPLFDSTRRS